MNIRVFFIAFAFTFLVSCHGETMEIIIDDFANTEDFFFELPELEVRQAMSFYGGKAVFVISSEDALLCDIYDLGKRKRDTTLVISLGDYPIPHANVACFGNYLFSDNSVFPLLYVSAWDKGREAFVFDISIIEKSYFGKLVQVVDPGSISDEVIGGGCLDWVVDNEGGFLYSVAYHKNPSTLSEGNYTHVTKFKLPMVQEGIVSLKYSDVIDSFILPVMNTFQDKCFYDNHIYVVAGYPDPNDFFPPKFYDIDVNNKNLVEHLIPIDGEPEGLCFYNGKKWMNMYGSPKIINLDKFLNL